TNAALREPGRSDDETEKFSLPDLQVTTFSLEQLAQHLAELCATSMDVAVSIKRGARGRAETEQSLASVFSKFVRKEVQSAQLRYPFGGSLWVDTLISCPEGVRLVRMPRVKG